jgi:hypothetical protein
LFHLGFLPVFIDLAAISCLDVGAVMVVTIMAVGGVKLGYAYAAGRAGIALGVKAGETMNTVAAWVMIAAGAFVVIMA